MLFSLILATYGRVDEVDNFLVTLVNQIYKKFEVIIVDQNEDERLVPIVKKYSEIIDLKYIKAAKGLSRARNVGLKYVSGQLIGFPDDDCWYFPTTLQSVLNKFKKHKADGLTGVSVDSHGQHSATNFDKGGGWINKYNVWQRGISFTIFFKKEVITQVGNFDENLGVGANTCWGSGEETDYLIRAISYGFSIFYDPDIVIGHPNPIIEDPEKYVMRVYRYSPGVGYVLKKHGYPKRTLLLHIIRPLTGCIISILKLHFDKAEQYYISALGKIWGWHAKI